MDTDQVFLQRSLNKGIKLFNENKLAEAEQCFKDLQNKKKTQLISFFYLGIINIKKKMASIADYGDYDINTIETIITFKNIIEYEVSIIP